MSSPSPIKQNAILLKNVSREITKLHNEILFIRNELTCIRDILKMDKDNVNVEIIEDTATPMKVDRKTESNSWFW